MKFAPKLIIKLLIIIIIVGWVRPDTCTAQDCLLREPLSIQKLSPNLLLVLIHASARNREVRDIIRKTWLVGLANHAYSPIQYR